MQYCMKIPKKDFDFQFQRERLFHENYTQLERRNTKRV